MRCGTRAMQWCGLPLWLLALCKIMVHHTLLQGDMLTGVHAHASSPMCFLTGMHHERCARARHLPTRWRARPCKQDLRCRMSRLVQREQELTRVC